MEYLAIDPEQKAIKLFPELNVFCGPYFLGLKRAYEKIKEQQEVVALTYGEIYEINPEVYLNRYLKQKLSYKKAEVAESCRQMLELNEQIFTKKEELLELKQNLLKLPQGDLSKLDPEKLNLLRKLLKEQERREIIKKRTQKEFEHFSRQLEKFLSTLRELVKEGYITEGETFSLWEKINSLKEEMDFFQKETEEEEGIDERLIQWVKEQENLWEVFILRENLQKEFKLLSLELKELLKQKFLAKKNLNLKQQEFLKLLLKELDEVLQKTLNFFECQVQLNGDTGEYRAFLERVLKNASLPLKKKIVPLCETVPPRKLIRLLNHPRLEKQPEYQVYSDLLYWLKGKLSFWEKFFLKNLILGEQVILKTRTSSQKLEDEEPEMQNLALVLFLLALEKKPVVLYYPERAMDTAKIACFLIPVLKTRRAQTIIITQNPVFISTLQPENVVLFGYKDKKPIFLQGRADNPEIKKWLLLFMEGGQENFARRQSYYQI